MKTLQTYLIEAIKPPRLSAKNKHLWKNGILDEEEVMKWLKENCRITGKVDIQNGKIDVYGRIKIYNRIKEFPYPFGYIEDTFDCSECQNLTSLKNAPEKVGRHFNCGFCTDLKSLEGAPKWVGGNFSCAGCNNLTSLEGAPEEVGGDFYCYSCDASFTYADVKKVCKVKGVIRV